MCTGGSFVSVRLTVPGSLLYCARPSFRNRWLSATRLLRGMKCISKHRGPTRTLLIHRLTPRQHTVFVCGTWRLTASACTMDHILWRRTLYYLSSISMTLCGNGCLPLKRIDARQAPIVIAKSGWKSSHRRRPGPSLRTITA
jgi:hypothetical protein